MTALAIDTLKLARRLRDTAGFTPEHAEAAAEAFADAVAGTALVTKEHLDAKLSETKAELGARIAELKAELKADLVEVDHHLEAKIAAVQGGLETKIAETKSDLLKWVFGALAAQTAFLSLIKFFGH